MSLFKKKKVDLFKGLYLLVVLAIMDIAMIYSFIVSGETGRNWDAIGFFFILNAGFIYVNFDVISIIYNYMKKHTFKEMITLIVNYKNRNKPKGILRNFQILVGVSLIAWALLSDINNLVRAIVIFIGLYNLWRSI